LCNYKPKRSDGHDRLSQSLLNFKNGVEPDVRAWIECSISELKGVFLNSGAAVVRALDHAETSATDSSLLQKLCDRIVKDLGLKSSCSALTKKISTKKLSLLSRRNRIEEISGIYIANRNRLNSDRIIVVDDIFTTGVTMSTIIGAIKQASPSASIKVFTFAFCEHFSDLNESLTFQGASYDWAQQGGWRMRDGFVSYGESFERICSRIRADNF
jgi:hypothetical protein